MMLTDQLRSKIRLHRGRYVDEVLLAREGISKIEIRDKRRFKAKIYGGETQIRTGDTRIFSPVLYQLSYLAT